MSISPRSSNSHHDNRTKVAVSVRTRITSRSRLKCVDKKEMYERNLCAFDYERCRTRSRSASCSENATHYGSCSNARLDSAASRRQRPPGGTASCIFMDALSPTGRTAFFRRSTATESFLSLPRRFVVCVFSFVASQNVETRLFRHESGRVSVRKRKKLHRVEIRQNGHYTLVVSRCTGNPTDTMPPI
jgi:hypothetical protein